MQGNITDWGKEVKKGLIERGWSINDLAERIGKSRTRVSGVVNGRIYSDSIASAISDLLNIEKASASMKEATRDWCMDARKAMIDLDMNTGELAEKGEMGSYITQYYNNVIIAFNKNSKYVQINPGEIAIYNYGVENSKKRAVFDETGNHFYRDGYYVGAIGTNQWSGNNAHKGLVFDLEPQGKYMAFAQKASSSATSYTTIASGGIA